MYPAVAAEGSAGNKGCDNFTDKHYDGNSRNSEHKS